MSIKEQLKQSGRVARIDGHGIKSPERYAPDTRHMVVLNVIKSYAGYATGGRVRLFLTDEGYSETIQADGRGDIKIIRHARVRMGGIEHDPRERGE